MGLNTVLLNVCFRITGSHASSKTYTFNCPHSLTYSQKESAYLSQVFSRVEYSNSCWALLVECFSGCSTFLVGCSKSCLEITIGELSTQRNFRLTCGSRGSFPRLRSLFGLVWTSFAPFYRDREGEEQVCWGSPGLALKEKLVSWYISNVLYIYCVLRSDLLHLCLQRVLSC
jgi:hypothetical protein